MHNMWVPEYHCMYVDTRQQLAGIGPLPPVCRF